MQEKSIIEKSFIRSFKEELYKTLNYGKINTLVFLCIGTQDIVGDLLGPLVGSKLQELFKDYNLLNINIYGVLNKNVHYLNIKNVLDLINKNNENICVIVIDSALSNKENIGNILVTRNKIMIGKSLNKNKILVGDIGIKVAVGENLKTNSGNFFSLNKVSKVFIDELSSIVSNGIYESIKDL